jgi:hypothetical protein
MIALVISAALAGAILGMGLVGFATRDDDNLIKELNRSNDELAAEIDQSDALRR